MCRSTIWDANIQAKRAICNLCSLLFWIFNYYYIAHIPIVMDVFPLCQTRCSENHVSVYILKTCWQISIHLSLLQGTLINLQWLTCSGWSSLGALLSTVCTPRLKSDKILKTRWHFLETFYLCRLLYYLIFYVLGRFLIFSVSFDIPITGLKCSILSTFVILSPIFIKLFCLIV